MTRIFRIGFIVAVATAFLPTVVAAQNFSADSLRRRIEVLERTMLDLQSRVRELEAHTKSEPARDHPVQASAKWRDLQNWRQLRRGMSMDEVRALLGEPERVDVIGGVSTSWRWESGGASVRFDGSSDRLDDWSEPRR